MTEEFEKLHKQVQEHHELLFGNAATNSIGMKDKIDEMYTILTQAKGLPWLVRAIIVIGASILVLKGWFNN